MENGDAKALQAQIDSLKAELALRSESANNRINENVKFFKIIFTVLGGIIGVAAIAIPVITYVVTNAFITSWAQSNLTEIALEEVQKTIKTLDVETMAKKEIKLAVATSKEALSKDLTKKGEEKFQALYDKGELELSEGKYKNAVNTFTEAINEAPHEQAKSYSYNYRGTAKFYLGLLQESLADFDTAIGFEIPGHARPHFNKGYILSLDPTKYEEAIDEYKKAIEVDPRYYKSYKFLAPLYFRNGDYENAAQTLQLLDKQLKEAK